MSRFFTFNLMTYCHKLVGIFEQLDALVLDKMPIIMGGDFNIDLTLRRLMSYIYMEHPFLMFLDHTQRRSTVGRTPLDE